MRREIETLTGLVQSTRSRNLRSFTDFKGLLRLSSRSATRNSRSLRFHIGWQALWLAGEARMADEVFATRFVKDYLRRWDYLEQLLQATELVEYPLATEAVGRMGDEFFRMECFHYAAKLYIAAQDQARLQKLAKRMAKIPVYRLEAMQLLRRCQSIS